MGCNATRSVLVSNMSSLSSSLDSEIAELKETRDTLISNHKKISSEENFIGKDLINLKRSIKTSLNQASVLIFEIINLPSFRSEINDNKQLKASVIAETIAQILYDIEEYDKLVIEKKNFKEKNLKLSKEILDAQEEKMKYQECYEENSKFFSNDEVFKKEITILEMQKIELNEEILEYNKGIRSLLRRSKSRVEDRVADLNEDDARVELVAVSKRVKGLKDMIEFYKKGNTRDIGLTFGKHEKQEKIIKDFNNAITLKKERIKGLRTKLHIIRQETEILENKLSESHKSEDKFSMINKIIQKCRSVSRTSNPDVVKKIIKKKALLSNIEETVSKVRITKFKLDNLI